MKIFLISNMYPSEKTPNYGVFVKNFVESLSKKNVDFIKKSVITGRGKNKVEKILKYIFFYLSIITKGIFTNYDLIYTHYGTHSALPILILKIFIKKPVVIHIHGDDLFSENNTYVEAKKTHGLLFPFFKSLSKKASLLVVPSFYYQKAAIRDLGVSLDNIFVYPSGGINLEFFKPLNKIECRNRFSLKENDFVIGIVSGIRPGKGWDVFLKAIKIVKDKNTIKNLKVFWVGDGSEKEKFDEMRNNLDLKDDFLHFGMQEHSNLPYIYNSFDIFIFPTLKESLGLVGLEALGCGVPIIGSNIPGLQDYIIDNENGYFFEPENELDLSNKIINFYNTTNEEKEKLKVKALETASNFESNKVSNELITRLSKVN